MKEINILISLTDAAINLHGSTCAGSDGSKQELIHVPDINTGLETDIPFGY